MIASFSQTASFGGAGVTVATVENMTDGLAEPFVGTNGGVGAHLTATLVADKQVASVTIAAPTLTGGWGADYLNGAALQRSLNGTDWTQVTVLSGFTHGEFKSIPVNALCRYLRVIWLTNNFLGIGEFDPVEQVSDRPWTYNGVPAATFGGTATFTYGSSDDWGYPT